MRFVNVARESGLRTKTIFGSEKRNRYLLETTGCGAAFVSWMRVNASRPVSDSHGNTAIVPSAFNAVRRVGPCG